LYKDIDIIVNGAATTNFSERWFRCFHVRDSWHKNIRCWNNWSTCDAFSGMMWPSMRMSWERSMSVHSQRNVLNWRCCFMFQLVRSTICLWSMHCGAMSFLSSNF
jgi:hypothetical protein